MTNHKSRTAETPDEDPRGSTDFEHQWDDLDDKVILVQILTELQQIRMALTQGRQDSQTDRNSEPMYECKPCGKQVTQGEKERHAYKQHKAPADMVGGMFTEVE